MKMETFSLRHILIVLSLVIISLIAWVFFPIVVVRGRTGIISSVSVVTSRQRQPLIFFGADTFAVIPKIEGAIEVRCTNGSAKVFGYVSKNTRSWIEITPDIAC
jgi:hypothetical protein